jgi:signal transduction histidine kinase/ActR/RegA family two-component response regulator
LHELSTVLTSASDIDTLFNKVLDAAMQLHGTKMGILSLYDETKAGLNLKVSRGFDEKFLELVSGIPHGESPCEKCFESGHRVMVEDIETDPIFEICREAAREAGFRSCHSTPLVRRSGGLIGVLSIHFPEPYRPSEREIHFMDLYARMATDLIENVRLQEMLQHQLNEREELLTRERNAHFEAQKANQAKDEFLAAISHELRTPLTSLLGWTRLLRFGNLPPMKFHHALQAVERSVDAQKQIIEDLLDVSGIISGKLQLDLCSLHLESIIAGAIDSLRPTADVKNITIHQILDTLSEPFTGDAARIQQIVCNLLSNSIKFTQEGGTIEVQLKQTGSLIRLVVRDNGQGIKPDFLPYVFDRFRQADGTATRKHSGLGLGLAIVQHLAGLHGGIVYAESMGERLGATFTVELPLKFVPEQIHLIEPQATKEMIVNPTVTSIEGLKVLIVEDEDDTREMLTLIFSQIRAQTKSVSSANEAMEVIGTWEPDILLSDIGMPGTDGYDLIRKVRALRPDQGGQIPAVAITAYAKPEDQERAIREGFSVHLAKPIELAQLTSIVHNLTEGFRAAKNRVADLPPSGL